MVNSLDTKAEKWQKTIFLYETCKGTFMKIIVDHLIVIIEKCESSL